MLEVKPLTQAGFAPFGDVIESEGRDSFFIDNEMAGRFHALAKVDHVEHHPLGSQAFIPVDDTLFIAVVAKACETPEFGNLRAFVTNSQHGINYHPATWHHALLTPYAAMTFICVDRVGSGNNCIDFTFDLTQQNQLDI